MSGSTQTTPITVFTGFLGSGKTTCILELVKRLPKGYKLCLLKNEFGDVEVDSELAREQNIDVQEMLNGCMCCVLVGQMKLALMELKEKYHPDRIIVETSGSAFPAPIAWQIRELEPEGFTLDSIVTVVDCENFRGYEDLSYTAKLQAQYSDIILLNKWELITERELDIVIDHVNELNTDTPKIKCEGRNVSPDLIFGLDTQLFQIQLDKTNKIDERLTGDGGEHFANEVDLIQVERRYSGGVIDDKDGTTSGSVRLLSREEFASFLKTLPKEDIFRLKGLVRLTDSLVIVNHAFGRWTFTEVKQKETLDKATDIVVKVTVMGNDLRMYVDKVRKTFLNGTEESDGLMEVKLIEAHRH